MNDASVALAARIVLAVVLAASAIAKLRSRAAVRAQVATLVSGAAPRRVIAAACCPRSSCVVAVALVVWWSPVPGVVALVLLALFTVVLVRAQARHVPCLCFGVVERRRAVGPGGGRAQRRARRAGGARDRLAAGADAGATLVVVPGVRRVAALAVRAAR